MKEQLKKVFPILFIILLSFNVYIWDQYYKKDDAKLHFYALDVGQGDSLYIKTTGGQDILIDGGPDEKIMQEIGRLIPFWNKDIEAVFLTHPNSDHYEGLKKILDRYTVRQIFLTEYKDDNSSYKEFLEKVQSEGAQITKVSVGDKIVFSENEKFEILSPKANEKYKDLNDTSIVGLFTHGETEILLTGDSVLSEVPGLKDIDILKVPHHGSKHNIDQKTADLVKPEISVITVGKNSYGHPTSEVLGILKNINSQILRTDQNGTIEIVSDGKNYYVK